MISKFFLFLFFGSIVALRLQPIITDEDGITLAEVKDGVFEKPEPEPEPEVGVDIRMSPMQAISLYAKSSAKFGMAIFAWFFTIIFGFTQITGSRVLMDSLGHSALSLAPILVGSWGVSVLGVALGQTYSSKFLAGVSLRLKDLLEEKAPRLKNYFAKNFPESFYNFLGNTLISIAAVSIVSAEAADSIQSGTILRPTNQIRWLSCFPLIYFLHWFYKNGLTKSYPGTPIGGQLYWDGYTPKPIAKLEAEKAAEKKKEE